MRRQISPYFHSKRHLPAREDLVQLPKGIAIRRELHTFYGIGISSSKFTLCLKGKDVEPKDLLLCGDKCISLLAPKSGGKYSGEEVSSPAGVEGEIL